LNHWHNRKPNCKNRSAVKELHHNGNNTQPCHEEAEACLHQCKLIAQVEVRGVYWIKLNTLLPAVTLFNKVRHVERWLLFHCCKYPFDWVVMLILNETDSPVFPYWSFQTHVKSKISFNGWVNHPIRPLNSIQSFIKVNLAPCELQLIIWNSYNIHKCEELTIRFLLFGVSYKPVGKGCFLTLLFDQLVFIDAPINKMESICYIKLALFVHV